MIQTKIAAQVISIQLIHSVLAIPTQTISAALVIHSQITLFVHAPLKNSAVQVMTTQIIETAVKIQIVVKEIIFL